MHRILIGIKNAQNGELQRGYIQTEAENCFFDAFFPLAAAALLVRMLRAAGITAEVVDQRGNIVKVKNSYE